MSNYATIKDGIVINTIVCDDSNISQIDGYHVKITDDTNIAAPGYEYDADKNKFKSPQPFESWVLNPDTLIWEAPVSKPEDGFYSWNEEDQVWIKVS